MNYRMTCLTPLLVGSGHKLSPIDYMVWKDQVNVLDQRRIFRLLAKGPRLEGYLTQLKKADKLDFASWGGFAQNFADRRVPFEHPSAAKYWEQARGESMQIPTFNAGLDGPYVPGSAIKGALRTGLLFSRWSAGASPAFGPAGERRRPGEIPEEQAIGAAGASRMRAVSVSDSRPLSSAVLKVYLLRVSTLVPRGPGRFELGWKQAPRGTVPGNRAEEGTPQFVEMAAPGSVFEGILRENAFLGRPEIARMLHWREPMTARRIFEAANACAERLLAIEKQYAAWASLARLAETITQLESELAQARSSGGCLLAMGWGSGVLAKTGWLDTSDQAYRQVLAQFPLYARAIESGLPFPKTRRIVFLGNQPAALAGWVKLETV
jgi:CRISPR-associated protein Csm5